MTMTESPPTAAHTDPDSTPPTAVSQARESASRTPDPVSQAPENASGTASTTAADPTKRGPLTRSQKLTAVAIVIAALGLAWVGLYLSFEHVASFAHERLGFDTLGKGQMFTVGVDTGIMVLMAVDLLMAWLRRPISWIRYPVWFLTGATVVLNAASAAPQGRAWSLLDYVAAFAHAVVPILFITVVEVGRHSIDRIVRPEEHGERDAIPWQRWLLALPSTFLMWRRMRLWGITSYPEMVGREQELRSYKVWLERKYKGDLKKATADERLPIKMADYGYTVAEALAMPDEQDRAAELREEEAEQRRLAAETRRKENQDAAEAAQEESATRLENTKIRLAGSTRAAQKKAERQATVFEDEAEAIETADAAEARLRAAEANERASEKERAASEAAAKAAEAVARTEAAQAAAEHSKKEAAEAAQAASEAELAASKTRKRVAEIEARALEMEDAARLTPRQRAVCKVARLILHRAGGDHNALPLAAIQHELGVTPGTASEYRTEAAELLAKGYRPGVEASGIAA